MDIQSLEKSIDEFEAEVIVGTKKFKGFKEKEILKLLDDFSKFVYKTTEKYPDLKNFYLKFGKVIYWIDYDELRELSGNEDEKIKKDDEEIMGIVKEEIKNYNTQYILIGKSKIDSSYKEILEIEKIKNACKDIGIRDLEIEKSEDKFKAIKNYLRKEDNFLLSYENSSYYSNSNSNYDKLQNFINNILGINYKIDKEKLLKDKISKVLEKENIRLAIWKSDESIYFIMAIPEFSLYNYLDESRFISSNSYGDNNICIFDYDINDNDFNFFEDNKFIGKINEVHKFLTNDELQKLIRKDKLQKQIETQKDNQTTNLNKKIETEFAEKGEITLNSIKRTKRGYFQFQNQKIGFKGNNILKVNYEENDFNNIFDDVCYNFRHIHFYNNKDKAICWVGNFKVTLKEIRSYYYIEDIRINQKEVEEVLKKAICFNKLKDYKDFLKEVSRCSIKIHNVINSGLVYDLNNDRWERDKIFSTIKVTRKNNKNYIQYKKELFKISNINRLMDMQKWEYKTSNIHIIATTLSEFSELNYDKALLVLKDGLQGYRLAKKRAKELLEETIKKLNIQRIDVDNSEISGKGYLVTGKSGKKYFIKEDLKVYEYPNFKYICIVDKGRIGNLNSTDLLISRLYACQNDTYLKEKVHTLNR